MHPLRPRFRRALPAILLLVFFVYRGASADTAQREVPRFPGPFACDAMTFYLVHDGGPLRATLHVDMADPIVDIGFGRRARAGVLAHFYDTRQVRIDTQYRRFGPDDIPRVNLTFQIEHAPPGIYPLRYTADGNRVLRFDLTTEPPVPFGIQPRREPLAQAMDGQFREVYFYVPPGAPSFRPEPTAGSGRLFDPEGGLRASFGTRNPPTVALDPGGVWRMELSLPVARNRFLAHSGDFDAIYCPDADTARRIHGALFSAEDGRLFPHRFQADMWNWILRLRPGDIDITPMPHLAAHADAFSAEPRNQHLLGPWGVFEHLPHILARQTLENPMSGRSTSLVLAAAFSLDEPFNPFFRDPRILNRLLLSEFHRYLALRQNDTPRAGMGAFVAIDAFQGDRTPFALAAPRLEDERLRSLWLEGARRHVERYAFHRTSCENQSTHVPINLHALYQGSGDSLYRLMAEDWIGDLLDPALNPSVRAGYLMEGYGPDATYQGLAANQLAWYYHWAGDGRVRDALHRIYRLFNHTVAPEPDGSILGASNFSHRTPGSWAQRQYGGGTLSMSPHLAEAAAWHTGFDPADPAYVQATAASMRAAWIARMRQEDPSEPTRAASEYRLVTRYANFPEHVLPDAHLPMVREERFDRSFDEQFFAVRRPAYYALVYAGRPDPDVGRIRSKDVPGGVQRRTGGGLSLFWTPGFGNAVLSRNWHAHANHMPRADLGGGGMDWPDYYTVEPAFNPEGGMLTVTSRMMKLPVHITRRMHFGDQRLDQEVTFTFEEDVTVEELVEQIPFPWTGKLLQPDGSPDIRSRIGDTWSPGVPPDAVDAVRLTHQDTGATLDIVFAVPVRARIGPLTTGAPGRAGSQVRGETSGLLEISLGHRFRAGQSVRLRYALVPGD